MADVVPEKTIENHNTQEPATRKKNKFFASVKWALFFIILIIITAAATYYYINNYYAKPAAPAEVQVEDKAVVTGNPDPAPVPDDEKAETVAEPQPEVVAEEEAKKEADTRNEEVRGNIESLNSKVARLEATNKNLLVYLTVKDLAASIENPEAFGRELEQLSILTADVPEISGRVDILKQAISPTQSAGLTEQVEMVTRHNLLAELDNVEKAVKAAAPKGFRAAIENALSDLVKITKTRGQVDAADYKSIINRARIVLSKENLSQKELEQVVNDMAKLGAPAQNWVKRANNYKRIVEVTSYLSIYAKSKLAE